MAVMTDLGFQGFREYARFFVAGSAKPKGSHRAFVRGGRAILAPASAGERGWRSMVEAVALEAMQTRAPWDEPMRLCLDFYSLRPKSHLRRDGTLKPGAQVRPTSKPDFDKLARSVADALTGICYRDDALVCDARVRKRYTNLIYPHCGAMVTVGPFEGAP